MNRQGLVPEHGTLSRYHGTTGVPACRCRPCTDRAVREDALRILERLAGRPRQVSAAPAREHLLKLQRQGLSYMQISRASNVPSTNIAQIARGRRSRINRHTATAILAVPLGWTDNIGHTDSTGTSRRLRALYAMGVSRLAIAAATGLCEETINKLINDDWPVVKIQHASAVRMAYTQLWQQPGASYKNRYRAQREGWPGPLCWNDDTIDDPSAEPDWTGNCGSRQGYRLHLERAGMPPPCPACVRAEERQLARESRLAA